MKKNKEIFNESSEKHSTCLRHSVYYKKSKLCIQNRGMSIENWNKLKKYNPKCTPKDLSLNLCNFLVNGLYNKATIKFTKLIVINQLLMLQFAVVMGEGNDCSNGTERVKYLCQFCVKFSLGNLCKQPEVSISVTCRCGKKKGDKYAEYGRFIMGPDGKVYDRLMMNPQMLQDGKIPEDMCQEGMQEQGMPGAEPQESGMQQTERKGPRIRQSKLQEPDINENGNKHKNKNSSTDYKNANDDELHVGYNTL